ncbi:hypothetical protein OG259_40650 [Streptomyces sp. NBC_00250]|uniref:hypothetical protein n=1 Tax=Streptomyces sp. NBC_00250 TaxID=2903641 RepID=UPI002E2B148B|nr:hypothetical protein [Streptomyces sp. NBC_00250]
MSTAAMLLVVAGCTSGTEQPGQPSKPSAVKPSAATRPTVTPAPYDKSPARPLGKAAATGRDEAFLRKAFDSGVPTGYEVPPVDEVAVIHRLSAETGELAWMPDGHTFCYGMVRGDYRSFKCGRLPEEAPAPGLLLTHPGDSDGVTSEDNLEQLRRVVFVMAEGGPKRFDHVKPRKQLGVVHQAVARFPSGRMVTFLTFDYPGHGWELDPEARICRSDRAICFPSQPVPD